MLHDFVELSLNFHSLTVLPSDVFLLLPERDLAKALDGHFGLRISNELGQFYYCETVGLDH